MKRCVDQYRDCDDDTAKKQRVDEEGDDVADTDGDDVASTAATAPLVDSQTLKMKQVMMMNMTTTITAN